MTKIAVCRLDAQDERPAFDCGDTDLNEYFAKDSRIGCSELLAVSYVVWKNDRAVGFFNVSNDAIQRETIPRRAIKKIPREKRYSSMQLRLGGLA